MILKNGLASHIQWCYSRKHHPGAQSEGFPCWTAMTRVSLNDAILVRSISEGPKRNHCHGTAIDMIGRKTPNLDPGVFYSLVLNEIFSYLTKHEICTKHAVFGQWLDHTKSKKTLKMCLLYSPSLVVSLWVTLGAKPLNKNWCQTRQYCQSDFDCPLSQSYFSEVAQVFKLREHSHIFYKRTPHMCLVCWMRNG